jgi:phosphopantetheine adenylyltransferase
MKSFKQAFSTSITEAKTKSKVVVVYGGGFQPFHAGHLSSYTQAKAKFRTPDFFVASSNDIKVRPIPFKDKEFLAQQAGVTDRFVQVVQPINPVEIMKAYDKDTDILILVRSERDPMKYTKKDGSAAYYQPFVSIDKCESFEKHAYIFVTKKHDFKVAGQEAFSGSQIRKMYSEADSENRDQIISDLYPKAKNKAKVKQLLDKYIGGGMKEEHEIEEARMSAAVKLSRAWDNQKAKSDASRKRAQELLKPKKPAESSETKKDEVSEAVLSISARRARGMQFRRMQSRIQTARKRASLRFASPEKLNNRARRAALRFLKARVSNNKSYASMSPGEKLNVDKRVQKMLPSVGRIASRLLPQVRNAETQRKASQTHAKESIDVNLQFNTLFSEAADKETNRIDQLVRMGLADKKMLSVIKQAVAKLKNGDTLNNNERKATNDLLTTLLDMVTSSDALFRMTKGELQKEDYSYEDDDYSDADSYYDAADKADDATDGLYMAKTQVNAMIDDAEEVLAMLDDMEEEPDAWVLSKITLAYDYVSTVKDYLEFNSEDDSEGENSDDEMDDEDMYNAVSGMSEEEFDSKESYRAWNSLFENKIALKQKAEKYGIPFEIISEVYARGIDSWDAEMNDTFTPQQWAFARVNSFVARGNGSWNKADKDLAERVMINEKFSNSMEWGTDSLRAKYAKDTPGQNQQQECACEDMPEEDSAKMYKKNLIKSLVAKKVATQSTEKK